MVGRSETSDATVFWNEAAHAVSKRRIELRFMPEFCVILAGLSGIW